MTKDREVPSPAPGVHLGRLEEFLSFLRAKLHTKADYAEAESLLHAAIDPTRSARRRRGAEATAEVYRRLADALEADASVP